MDTIKGDIEFDYGSYQIKCVGVMFGVPTLPVTAINNKITLKLPNPVVQLVVSNMNDSSSLHPSLKLSSDGTEWHIQKAASNIKIIRGDHITTTISVNIANVKRHDTIDDL